MNKQGMLAALVFLVSPMLMAETALFYYDDKAASDLSIEAAAPLQPGLVDDGQRLVNLDSAALLSGGVLNLPDGNRYKLELIKLEKVGSKDWVWHGRLVAGDGMQGTATFTVRDQKMAGLFAVGERRFELQPLRAGQHALLEFDPDARPAHHPAGGPQTAYPETAQSVSDKSQPIKGQPSEKVTMDAASDSDALIVINVLGLYTPEAASVASSEASLRLSIENALNATNTAYINSDAQQRVRLTGLVPLSKDEEDMESDLGALRTNSEAQSLRDHYAADLVALIGNYSGSGFCGIGYIKTDIGSGFEDFAYSITRRSCLSNQTLAHELGHNMGLDHDPDNAGIDGDQLIRPYAFGHRVPGEFRTIMAYPDGCSGCPQIDHFSNPDVETDAGIATGLADERDNVRTLAVTAPSISQFREPLKTLAEALNAESMSWQSGGPAPWYVQDDVTRDDEPVPVSGALVDGERSWLEASLDQAGMLAFDWKTEFESESQTLDLLVNGEVIEQFNADGDGWQTASVQVEAFEPLIRFEVRAPDDAGFDSIGRAYVTNVAFGEQATVGGRVVNLLGQGIADVTVTYLPESGDEEVRTTGSDGNFVMNRPAGSVDDADELLFEGTGLADSQRPATECLGNDNDCEEVMDGEARQISGTVSGLGPGEAFDMVAEYLDDSGDRQVHTSQAVEADESGQLSFQLDADSSVHYERVDAQISGYQNRRFAPEGGISLREGDLDGVDIEVTALRPGFTSVETLETGENSFTASASLQTHGRTQEVTLRYGKGSLNESETQTIPGDADERSEVVFEVSGLDCGSGYSWRMDTVSDTGAERSSAERSAQTESCPGGSGGGSSSSSGCTLDGGESARLDPVLALLMLLAAAMLMRRRYQR